MADDEIKSLMKDMIKVNSIIACELIQLVENSAKQVHGKIPDKCVEQHMGLRKEIVEIAEKWNGNCQILSDHNLRHGE